MIKAEVVMMMMKIMIMIMITIVIMIMIMMVMMALMVMTSKPHIPVTAHIMLLRLSHTITLLGFT